MKRTWVMLLVLMGAWATAKTPSELSGMTSGTLESGGRTRSYTLFVPAFTPASTSTVNTDAPKALVLALHGRTEIGESMAKLTGLNRVAEQHGFIALYPVTGTLGFWADHIGCDAKIDASALPPRHPKPTTTVHRIAFRGCPPGATLTLYAVTGGGHNWLGRPGFIPEAVAGTVSLELDAGKAVWNFFAAASR